MAELPIFTVGHSTRPVNEFIDLLRSNGIRRLVDVRTIPRSRMNRQYSYEILPGTLSSCQIAYTLIPELGGRRKKQPDIDPSCNSFWQNQSFHNYADYAVSREFGEGLKSLSLLSEDERCAIMCAEAVWWRCHRRIIADYLLLVHGKEVFHIMGNDRVERARATPSATIMGSALCYPGRGEQA